VALEAKGLKVNMGKTKVLRCRDGAGMVEKAGKDLCGVCRKGVESNSILCMQCKFWVHKRCCGVKGGLKNAIEVDYIQGGPTNVAQLWRLITLRVFIENTHIIYQIKDKYLVYAHAKY